MTAPIVSPAGILAATAASARAVATVSADWKAPRSNRIRVIGSGIAMSAAAAGTVSNRANSIALFWLSVAPATSPARTCRDNRGKSTMPTRKMDSRSPHHSSKVADAERESLARASGSDCSVRAWRRDRRSDAAEHRKKGTGTAGSHCRAVRGLFARSQSPRTASDSEVRRALDVTVRLPRNASRQLFRTFLPPVRRERTDPLLRRMCEELAYHTNQPRILERIERKLAQPPP